MRNPVQRGEFVPLRRIQTGDRLFQRKDFDSRDLLPIFRILRWADDLDLATQNDADEVGMWEVRSPGLGIVGMACPLPDQREAPDLRANFLPDLAPCSLEERLSAFHRAARKVDATACETDHDAIVPDKRHDVDALHLFDGRKVVEQLESGQRDVSPPERC